MKDDTISRQAAIDALYHVDEYNGRSIEAIKNLPSAERHGRWSHYYDDMLVSGTCSVCGWRSIIMETDVADMPYCPNCGSRMDLEGEEE